VKLAPDRQDALLLHGIVFARIVSRQRQCRYGHRIRLGTTISEDLADVREALRLDDEHLGDLVTKHERSGQAWGPWQSEPDQDRATS
jgi:hypothetical protein